MSDRLPFLLREAQFALYPTDASGVLQGPALWFGGFINKLRTAMDYEEVLLKASGDRYSTAHHVDEAHVLSLGQSWIIFAPTMADWKPVRNQQYQLQLIWTSGGRWLRRVYSGVTWRTLALESVGTNQLLVDQTLRAQAYNDDGGSLALGTGAQPPATVPAPSPGGVQVLAFYREATLIVNEYLLGFYAWTSPVTLVGATVTANAPQGTPMVLGLEVGGVLTGQTLTIPVGTVNTEVTASVALSGVVAPGELVRWQILSGPAPVNAAWGASVAMQVTG